MGGTAMGHRPSAFRAFLLAPIAFAISPSLAHAHGDVTSNADSLRVLLSEWSLEIDAIRVGAGIVRVRAVNVGTLRHNLPVTKAGTFSEIYQTPLDRKSTRLNYSSYCASRLPSSAGQTKTISKVPIPQP